MPRRPAPRSTAAALGLRLVSHLHVQAVLSGALLGALAFAMSARPGHAAMQLAMAIVMLLAGGGAFVCHALHHWAQGRSLAGALRRRAMTQARTWICLFGLAAAGAIALLGA